MLAHSYAEHGNWYVMMVLDAFQLAGYSSFGRNHALQRHGLTTVFTSRSLSIASPFIPGEYRMTQVAPVDLAVTFASLAGVNRPFRGSRP